MASDGEVVLQLRYAALNPADRYLAEKQYPARPKLPHVLGRDGVGDVVTTHAAVQPTHGNRMLILRGDTGVQSWGTFAEKTAVAAESIVPIPKGWSDQEAAAGSLVYLTAYQAITQWGPLPKGAVLITGASGGVGIATIQLAKALGLPVIALSRDSSKKVALIKQGASHVADPGNPKWPEEVREALGGKPIELCVENIGGENFSRIVDIMGQNGKISVVGRLAGPVPNFNTASLFFRRMRIGGVAVGTYSALESRNAWDHVVRLLANTGARPLIDSVFPFDQLHQAFERLASGPLGKVLIDIQAR
ncbi:zinc-binding alcohol dehydrogenase family protein [Candidatus Sumerlaeota bacterium]|nr:zinc-binding alcohol dehydrogenase family protein [Candidatus Sumerlaeota bacterium]